MPNSGDISKMEFPAPGAAQIRFLAWQPMRSRVFARVEDLGRRGAMRPYWQPRALYAEVHIPESTRAVYELYYV